jgi:hypothetical protein
VIRFSHRCVRGYTKIRRPLGALHQKDTRKRLDLLHDQFLFVDLDHKRSSVLASGEPETSRGREGHGDAKVKRRSLALVISS